MPTKLIATPPFTLNFPNIFDRVINQNDELEYNCQAVIDEEHVEDWEAIRSQMESLKTETFGKKPADIKFSLRNCDTHIRQSTGEPESDAYEYLKGKHAIKLLNKKALQIKRIGLKKEELEKEEFYSGCVCRAVLELFTYDVKKNSMKFVGVSARLLVIQKLKNGPHLGMATATPEEALDSLGDVPEGYADDNEALDDILV